MADNVNITQGAGTIVAADDIGGGVLAQRVKLSLGPDGTGIDALAGVGVNGTGVQRVTIATDQGTITTQLPAALGTLADAASVSAAFTTEGKAQLALINTTAVAMSAKLPAALGNTTKAASLGVALATDDLLVTLCAAPATGTQTNVASSATDVTVLASNASRKGAYVYNDSTQVLFLLLSNATSSATVFTQKLAAGDSYSLAPGSYTGVLKGIWASANGFARVTEFT